eukprot:TRINITY_DN623_c0_g2_i1.p1 TRINITY_DN623_c0_g2~~TRINITY_DN623_c0_g2_i1.p1  ORF type:complete len:222 (+),score=18.77 TRINITY_DN623_c0_g2_i1:180-845(+)
MSEDLDEYRKKMAQKYMNIQPTNPNTNNTSADTSRAALDSSRQLEDDERLARTLQEQYDRSTHTPVAPNQPEERKANSLTLPPPRPNNDDYVSMQVNEYRQARESGARNCKHLIKNCTLLKIQSSLCAYFNSVNIRHSSISHSLLRLSLSQTNSIMGKSFSAAASNNNSSERKGVIAYFKSFECDSITKLTTCCCMTICVGIGVLFIMSLQNAHPHNLQPI